MKQAVVLIHGIGEQKPMDTLRSFVSAILPSVEKGTEQYWSHPDPMSDLLELRRLQATGRTKTHFYEYYWAYQVDGTKLWHLVQWFSELLFRGWRDVPVALRGIWLLSWALTSGLIAFVATDGVALYQGWFAAQSHYGKVWLALTLVTSAVLAFLVYYVGDAARYLSPHPQNIALRQKIRAEGLGLLMALHDSRDYDRIIIVGHSLGSVIGYDLITHLWPHYNTVYNFQSRGAELVSHLVRGSAPQPMIRHVLYDAAQSLSNNLDESLNGYRDAQAEAWKEQRHWGNPWRITDFVTMGSPLAHAMLLLARGSDEFDARKRQRELPTCPPVRDQRRGFAYPNRQLLTVGEGRRFTALTLHHAAPFAVTRWTNLYFPAYLGLFGDIIGGPLRNVFGLGIKDVPVKLQSLWHYTLAAHVSYWKQEGTNTRDEQHADERRFALDALKDALNLTGLRRLREEKADAAAALDEGGGNGQALSDTTAPHLDSVGSACSIE